MEILHVKRTFLVVLVFLISHIDGEKVNFKLPFVDGIRNEQRIRTSIHKYAKEANDIPPFRLDSVMAELGPLTGSENSLVNSTARSLLYTALQGEPYRYEVGKTCLNHTEIYLEALLQGRTYALQMIDAMGKPPSNILGLNTYWLGSYEECIAIKAGKWISATEQTGPFNGMYCSAYFDIGDQQAVSEPLTIGLCFPDSCSDWEATVLTNLTVSLLPLNSSSPLMYTSCKRELEYSSKAIVVIVVCSIFLALITVATFYDMVIVRGMLSCLFNCDDADMMNGSYTSFKGSRVSEQTPLVHKQTGGPVHDGSVKSEKVGTNKRHKPYSYTPGLIGKLLLSFSAYSNSLKILNTNQSAGTLTAVNGIRFISMTWVILGHTFDFCITYTDNLNQYLPQALRRLSFQIISNATFAVDTFFVLSGLLVSFLSLKEMKKRGGAGKFKWGMFYFHRFWRLTPPYMLFLMFYVTLFKYWSNGPLWPQQGIERDECKDSWWKNLLYINNFSEMDEMCMSWSWYLSNDMQFYVVSPLLLVPLYYSPLWGSVTCLAFILVNFITAGVISSHHDLTTNLIFAGKGEENKYFHDVYIKPWCRIGPYVVGFFTGYVLYKSDCKIRMSKLVNTLGWTLATVVSILVLYGLYTSDGQAKDLGNTGNALYNATSRTAWGMCIAWVVFACATGYGGPVNTLLSWHGVIPLSRLTYCAYLVHPVIMNVAHLSMRTTLHMYDLQLVYYFLGNICLAYAVAFAVSLVFESPMMGLEKALLGRGKTT